MKKAAAKCLYNNASKYGFILRYPKSNERVAAYKYESWHFRYVGIKLATNYIMLEIGRFLRNFSIFLVYMTIKRTTICSFFYAIIILSDVYVL